jgi:hypothetical protein
VTLSRNQPVLVTEQSVIAVKAMRIVFPAQPPAPQAASRSTVVLAKVLWVPVKTAAPAALAGGQVPAIVPL